MKKGKVLLVDDNLDMLIIGQRIFTRAGFEYLSARSGQEGLQIMLQEGADLVVLDYMLPDLNGTQFIKSVVEEAEYTAVKQVPIVVLTARTDHLEDLDEWFRENLRAILIKPFGHRELVNVVENILRVEKVRRTLPPRSAGRSVDWADDLRIAANTIARLSTEIRQDIPAGLGDQQRLDLEAVYTSSKRLLRLIDEGFPESEIFQPHASLMT